jgi:hypothetical protein
VLRDLETVAAERASTSAIFNELYDTFEHHHFHNLRSRVNQIQDRTNVRAKRREMMTRLQIRLQQQKAMDQEFLKKSCIAVTINAYLLLNNYSTVSLSLLIVKALILHCAVDVTQGVAAPIKRKKNDISFLSAM